jgi:hypothetical protein
MASVVVDLDDDDAAIFVLADWRLNQISIDGVVARTQGLLHPGLTLLRGKRAKGRVAFSVSGVVLAEVGARADLGLSLRFVEVAGLEHEEGHGE